MLLALVLAACVAPAAHEWVEISQQHYRKPSRTHAYPTSGTFYPADEDTDDLRYTLYPIEGTTNTYPNDEGTVSDYTHISVDREDQKRPNRVYLNQSISKHYGNNDEAFNIKRVSQNVKIRPNVTPEFSLEIYGQVTEGELDQVTNDYSSVLKDKDILSATIERVPNKGSVKRVQLSNTPVKSPTFINAGSPIRRNDIRPYGTTAPYDDIDEFDIKSDILKNAEDAVSPINNLFSTTKETTIWKYDRIVTSTSEPAVIFQKYPQRHQLEKTMVNNSVRDRGSISNVKNTSTERNQVFNENNNNAVKSTLIEKIKEQAPNLLDKNDKVNKPEDKGLEKLLIGSNTKNNINASIGNEKFQFSKGYKPKASIDRHSEGDNDEKEKIKVNTMEHVMKFVKLVADTISKNTKGVNGKVKYLNELKETLLNSIQARLDTAWPDDSTRGARRSRSAALTARAAARAARGHVEFPSSESSLMTISFLTFAVFLIKLVLQVIQTYKNKAMMVAPLMVATAGRARSPH